MTAPVRPSRRASYFFLCALPFVAIALTAIRPLRISGVYQLIGAMVFASFAIALWSLAGPTIRAGRPDEIRLAAIAGSFLILPFGLIATFWVGLGPPWVANAAENQMRYVVLVAAVMAVVSGFVALKEALVLAGERFHAALGFAGIILTGPLYLVGEIILLAAYAARLRSGRVPPVFLQLNEMQDILLFFGGALTYAATAAFAVSLRRAGWLGHTASRAFVAISMVALLCLLARGLAFPDPAGISLPWYLTPGFVAGIPAVPFIIPSLFGAIALRRATRNYLE